MEVWETCFHGLRLPELEREHGEVIQQRAMENQMLSALREDLIQEKMRSQQLTAQLDLLTAELQRMGIQQEKIANSQKDETHFKALQTLLEEALKKNMEVKEEKISALESRLQDATNRNAELKVELQALRRQHETLCQQPSDKRDASAASEILALKDHLVSVEREVWLSHFFCLRMLENFAPIKKLKTLYLPLRMQLFKLTTKAS